MNDTDYVVSMKLTEFKYVNQHLKSTSYKTFNIKDALKTLTQPGLLRSGLQQAWSELYKYYAGNIITMEAA